MWRINTVFPIMDSMLKCFIYQEKESIGILTASGDLFCGDLLANLNQPEFWFIDDSVEADASLKKLKSLKINLVYPGHGKPFLMGQFIKEITR